MIVRRVLRMCVLPSLITMVVLHGQKPLVSAEQPSAVDRTVPAQRTPELSLTTAAARADGARSAQGDNPACGPGAGDCCAEGGNGTPGCDDEDCCNCICNCDPFCCDSSWDGLCAGDGFEPGCGASLPDGLCGAECSECLSVCGDGECGDGENCANCEADCGACVCGDGNCEPGENACNCPADCPGVCECRSADQCDDASACTDDTCDPDNPEADDFGCVHAPIEPCCGDGECGDGENCETCPQDCDPCPTCGDDICGGDESCDSCPEDCGACICGPGAGDCCSNNGAPGCEDDECCAIVCEKDPVCCDGEWDQACADLAAILCPELCGCPDGKPCDDGDPCTENDICSGGECGGDPIPCKPDEVCVDGECVSEACPDGEACDDGDACTVQDTCAGGVCVAGEPVECPQDQPCDPKTGKCVSECGDCPTDVDSSGNTGASDLAVLLGSWGPCAPGDACECLDDNSDGVIGAFDLAVVLGAWGPCENFGGGNGFEAPNFASGSLQVTTANSEPVYLFSGEYYLETVDLRIPGRGFDFVWSRKYRSRETVLSAQGIQWDFSYSRRVETAGPDRILFDGNSRRDVYEPEGPDCWTRPGFFRTLCLEPNGAYVLTFPDLMTWTFAPLDGSPIEGKLIVLQDRNGNTMTFDYDGLGRLVTIHDTLDTPAHNRDIVIAYNADGFIESVTDWVGRQLRYEYYQNIDLGGSFGDLKSVTYPVVEHTPEFPIPPGHDFPNGKTWTFTYTENMAHSALDHNLTSITDGRGQTYLTITYSNTSDPLDPRFDRVIAQQYGNGVFQYVYIAQNPTSQNNFATTKTIVNDRMGNVEELFFNTLNHHVMRHEYTGRADPTVPTTNTLNRPTGQLRPGDPLFFETRYEYNSDFLLTREEFANQNVLERTYDSPNPSVRSHANLLLERRTPGPLGGDQAEIIETYTYHPTYNFIATHIDGRGFTTTHTYDPATGDRLQTDQPTVTLGVLGGGSQTIVEQYEYNAFGQMTRYVNPTGRIDEYEYYVFGLQRGYLEKEIFDVANFALTTTRTYDAVGNTLTITDPRGNTEQRVHNQLDQVVRHIAKPPFLYETDFFYDGNDNRIRIDIQNIDDQGILQANTHLTVTYEYDILDNRIRETEEVDIGHGIVTEYEYDANDNWSLTRFGEATNGNQTTNVVRTLYDERDLLFREIRAEGAPAPSTTQSDYDGNQNLVRVSAGLEGTPRTTIRTFDGYDRLLATTDPMGNVRTRQYDANNNLVSSRKDGELIDVPGSVANARLSEATFLYDEIDRRYQTDVAFFDTATGTPIDDGFSTDKTFYDAFSKVIRVEEDNGNGIDTSYDTANRESVLTDAKSNTVAFTYDANSNVTLITELEKSDLGNPDETYNTNFDYDSLDRLVVRVDNIGNQMEYGYDSRDNETVMTDALSHETRYVYDGVDRLIQTILDMNGNGASSTDPDDILTGQVWDDTSRLVGQSDDNVNTLASEYDGLHRVTKTTYQDGTEHISVYDVHDNEISRTDANGSVSTSTYDLLDRLSSKTIVPGPGVSAETTFENYEYDGRSRLIRGEDNDSVLTYGYNSLSHTTSETVLGQTITSVYDGVGNRVSCTYPGGRVIFSTYDELDRKKTISDGGGTVVSYAYIGPRRVERREYGNGTRTEYEYDGIPPNGPDDFGRRQIIRTKHSVIASGTIIDERTYRWDRMQNKTQRKDVRAGGPQLTHDYTYDDIYRLIHTTVTDSTPTVVRNTDYDLDGVGNRTTVAGAPDPGPYTLDPTVPQPADFQVNQYTSTSFDDREYDDNGNLVAITSSGGNLSTITYNYRNQMVEYFDGNTGQRHVYVYDAIGRRIIKIVDADVTAVETRYFRDGTHVVEEQDGAGVTQNTYAFGQSVDEIMDMLRGGNHYYYHADELFNIMALTDAAGAVVERYDYQDYGVPEFRDVTGNIILPIIESAVGNPFPFNTRRYDAEIGFYCHRTRFMDPRVGRFTTRDTIGAWGDPVNLGNAYTYVGNNPATWTDPFGLAAKKGKVKAATTAEELDKQKKDLAEKQEELCEKKDKLKEIKDSKYKSGSKKGPKGRAARARARRMFNEARAVSRRKKEDAIKELEDEIKALNKAITSSAALGAQNEVKARTKGRKLLNEAKQVYDDLLAEIAKRLDPHQKGHLQSESQKAIDEYKALTEEGEPKGTGEKDFKDWKKKVNSAHKKLKAALRNARVTERNDTMKKPNKTRKITGAAHKR